MGEEKSDDVLEERSQSKFRQRYVVLIIALVLAVGSSLAFKDFRRQICYKTNLCFYTCDEYGRNTPIKPDAMFTCEQVEIARREMFLSKMKAFVGIQPKKPPCQRFKINENGVVPCDDKMVDDEGG